MRGVFRIKKSGEKAEVLAQAFQIRTQRGRVAVAKAGFGVGRIALIELFGLGRFKVLRHATARYSGWANQRVVVGSAISCSARRLRARATTSSGNRCAYLTTKYSPVNSGRPASTRSLNPLVSILPRAHSMSD